MRRRPSPPWCGRSSTRSTPRPPTPSAMTRTRRGTTAHPRTIRPCWGCSPRRRPRRATSRRPPPPCGGCARRHRRGRPSERLRAAFHACLLSAVDLDPRDALRDVADVRPAGPLAGWFHSAAAWAHLRLGHLDDAIAAGELAQRGGRSGGRRHDARAHRHRARSSPIWNGATCLRARRSWRGPVPCPSSRRTTGVRLITARLHAARRELDRAIEVVREAIEHRGRRAGAATSSGMLYAELVELALAADDEATARDGQRPAAGAPPQRQRRSR